MKNDVYKQALSDILMHGFDHLNSLGKAIEKLQKEAKDEEEAKKKTVMLSMIFTAINDVIHPGYAHANELFKESNIDEFVTGLLDAHSIAVKEKIFPPCNCASCKQKVENESASGNTDKA